MGGEDSDRGLVRETLVEDDNEEPVGLIDGAVGGKRFQTNGLQILSAMTIMKTPISRCRIFGRFEAKKG